MNLNRMETTILSGILADLRAWREWYRRYQNDPDRPLRRYVLREYLAGEDATARGIVKMDLAGWLGRVPTASDKVLASRGYAQLESLGLIERLYGSGGERTSAIRVTALGERMACKAKPKRATAAN